VHASDARRTWWRERASRKRQDQQDDAYGRGDGHRTEVVSRQEDQTAGDRAECRGQDEDLQLPERGHVGRLDARAIVSPDPTRSPLRHIRCYFNGMRDAA